MAMRTVIIILVILPIFFIGCSSKKTTAKKVDNPGVLYVEGVDLMKKKKYDDAIKKFNAVRENYPFDPIADVAMVKLADTYFEKKEYLYASGVYADFVTAHPDDENVPYALWRLGTCFEKLSLTIDRDQSYTLKAIERFTYLKNRYPTSQYAREADEHVVLLTQKLADRELYVGDYYYRTGRYNAAATRLEYFLSKYPGAKGTDRVLFLLAATYRQLDAPDKVLYYTELLMKQYPNSTFAKSQTKASIGPKVTTAKASAPLTYVEKQPQQSESKAATPPLLMAANRPAETSSAAKPDAKSAGQTVQTASVGGEAKPPLALPVTEEKKPRQIVLRPNAPPEANPAEDQAQKSQVGNQQEARSDTSQEGAAKPGEKDKGFGFFKQKKPVDVVADMMEGLEKGKVILFKGNVVAKQEDLQIFSDTLTAYLNEETDEIDKADAKGHVRIIKAERTATCEEAFFENAKGEITLKGNVVVYSGTDRLAGDTVIYYINEDRVMVESEKDKKVRITVQPK